MSAQELKISINELVKKKVVGFEPDGKPITVEELERIVVASSENAKKGYAISHQNLFNGMKIKQ